MAIAATHFAPNSVPLIPKGDLAASFAAAGLVVRNAGAGSARVICCIAEDRRARKSSNTASSVGDLISSKQKMLQFARALHSDIPVVYCAAVGTRLLEATAEPSPTGRTI